jgi:hypothetical protein
VVGSEGVVVTANQFDSAIRRLHRRRSLLTRKRRLEGLTPIDNVNLMMIEWAIDFLELYELGDLGWCSMAVETKLTQLERQLSDLASKIK